MNNLGPFPKPIYDELVEGFHDAFGIRYLSVAGLVILACEHIQTFEDEVRLVWRAPASFTKYTFLVNRYLVLGSLVAAMHAICGFNGAVYSNYGCTVILSYISIASAVSMGLANLLVLVRVLGLWDKNRRVLLILVSTYVISYSVTCGFLAASIAELAPNVRWVPVINVCALTTKSRYWTTTWAAPFLFDATVLTLTIYNAFARPRSASIRITDTMRQDGILFFVVSSCLAGVNLGFTSSKRPSRVSYAALLVWAMITVTLNRLLLHIRYSEIRFELSEKQFLNSPPSFMDEDESEVDEESGQRTATTLISPFTVKSAHHTNLTDTNPFAPVAHIEMQSFFR